MPLLLKKFPGKIAEPMWAFAVAGLVVIYGVNSAANAMMDSDEYKNDPRNPRRKLHAEKPAAAGS